MARFVSAGPRPGHITVRASWLALRLNVRALLYAQLAALALVVLAAWAMTLGSYRIPLADTVRAMLGDGAPDHTFVVRTLRLPRVGVAALIGACLAMSGAIFQALVRNPLVSPDIIGIESGATVCAVFWIVTGQPIAWLPIAAFVGAVLAATLVYLLSWRGGIWPHRLILVGIGIGALLSAVTTLLTVRFPIEVVRPAIVWSVGSIFGSDWGDVRVLLVATLLLAPAAIALTWPLRRLHLGDDIARSLGAPLETTRLAAIAVGCGLCAVSVAIAGPIGFVALMVPHMARMLAGPLAGSTMLFTALLGACYLLAADVVAQHLFAAPLPVGVVTAAVGAPYFLFLLYRFNARI